MSDSPLTFDFTAPSRIVFGWGRRAQAGVLARSLGRRAFVICGSRTLESQGELGRIVDALHEFEVETVSLGTVTREPLWTDVDDAVARLRESHAGAGDLLLAVGGGSAIDLAKAAGALVTNRESDTVRDYLEGVGRGCRIVNAPLPLLAMPTTAGTGTEGTKNAVISSFDPPFKKSLRSELMVPRVVLFDPELTVSVPPKITAWTGMDAITQLIESYLSKRATAATRGLAQEGLQGTVSALRTAFRDGSSRPARERMAYAAMLSGIALANSGLGMAHGVAAALGVHCHVPHGLACAVMLPVALRVNLKSAAVRRDFSSIAPILADVPTLGLGRQADDAVEAAVESIECLLDELQIPQRLSEIGVRDEQIPAIVRDSHGNSMSGNPRDLADEELTQILEDML